jgi:hypothetical protein
LTMWVQILIAPCQLVFINLQTVERFRNKDEDNESQWRNPPPHESVSAPWKIRLYLKRYFLLSLPDYHFFIIVGTYQACRL